MDRNRHESPPLASPSGGGAFSGLVFTLVVAALARFVTYWGVDLRGAFGPDAPGAAASAILGPFGHPYPLHPLGLAALTPFLGGDPSLAAHFLSLVAGLATVAAVWSMGRSLGGDQSGRAAGTLAAVAPLMVQDSLLCGGDALALGLASWGAALSWSGASAQGRDIFRQTPMVGVVRVVVGGILVGLSAAAKPIALPVALLILVAPAFGGYRTIPWAGLSLALAAMLAGPFLRPLLWPQGENGLLGSWWWPSPPDLAEIPAWLVAGGRRFVLLCLAEPWFLGLPLFFLALMGSFVRGYHWRRRLLVMGLASLSILLVSALVGDRLRPRYLTGASLGWIVLAGYAVLPVRFRRTLGPEALPMLRRATIFEALPLSLLMTLMLISTLAYWDAMASLRAREEGTAPSRGWVKGWTDGFGPGIDFAESSICGALELERLGRGLAGSLPAGSTVVVVPLRDGRSWHLLGPILQKRNDLATMELNPECCPGTPAECAERLPHALAATGGVLVVPLEPEGRCQTGAVPAGTEDLVGALLPLVSERKLWYGTFGVSRDSSHATGGFCEAMGGREPEAAARP